MILHCSTGVELKDLQDLVVRRLPPRFQRGSFSVSAGKVGPGMRDQNLDIRLNVCEVCEAFLYNMFASRLEDFKLIALWDGMPHLGRARNTNDAAIHGLWLTCRWL